MQEQKILDKKKEAIKFSTRSSESFTIIRREMGDARR